MEPDPRGRAELIADCVHCGFCLPTCPTYLLWGEEMDSPRGRIHLMKQLEEAESGAGAGGALGPDRGAAFVQHFDRCLGCMACVTSCPSGVRYDRLIELTRAGVEADFPRTRRDRALRRAIFATFPYPRRLRALRAPLRLYQKARLARLVRPALARYAPGLAAMERLAPEVPPPVRLPARVPARGPRRAVVGMLTGCVQHAFFPQVNAATARVLAAEGCEVVIPRAQGCCGALSRHAGRAAEADRFAETTMRAFDRAGVDAVVVNAAGCGSVMKEYPPGFARLVRDFAEWLAELGPVAPRHPVPLRVAYHDACHLAHAQGIRAQPRALLGAIPGLELLEIAEPEICCGSAGIYNLLQPTAAAELGGRKAANVARTRADLLVAANPGCAMQIAAASAGAGRGIPVAHTAEVLDASLRGRPAAVLLGGRR